MYLSLVNARSENFEFDLVILGGGASGLLVVDQLLDDPFFSTWNILLIEKDEKVSDDRTWCYWEAGAGRFDQLLTCEWKKALFKNEAQEKFFDLSPYTYKMLRSSAFYNHVYSRIRESSCIQVLKAEVLTVNDTPGGVEVQLSDRTLSAKKCLSSIRDLRFLKNHRKYPLLQQHFVGWFIETRSPVFDEQCVTLMDFSVDQKGNTRFMYVLPLSKKKALIEYTLFSADLLQESEYESEIKGYLDRAGITEYRITEKEKGNIPMTAYPFHHENSGNLMYIGTAGGWTKASTGYTFYNAMRKAKALKEFLKSSSNMRDFTNRTRFDLYDRIFLNVLFAQNGLGEYLFSRMFIEGDPVTMLKFLNNDTAIAEELHIMAAMPTWLFLKNVFKPTA